MCVCVGGGGGGGGEGGGEREREREGGREIEYTNLKQSCDSVKGYSDHMHASYA